MLQLISSPFGLPLQPLPSPHPTPPTTHVVYVHPDGGPPGQGVGRLLLGRLRADIKGPQQGGGYEMLGADGCGRTDIGASECCVSLFLVLEDKRRGRLERQSI